MSNQTRFITLANLPTQSGHGVGRGIGIPTINIDTASIPHSLSHGIYAARVTIGEKSYDGAMHYGPRPVFDDPIVSAEVHILDHEIHDIPPTIDIEIIAKIRDVQNFASVEAMTAEISRDIEKIRGILHPS